MFIQKATTKHNDRYDYSLTEYITSSDKVAIICKEHGVFYQLPHNHLKTKGCPKCGRNAAIKKYKKYTYEDIQNAALLCTSRGEFRKKYPAEYNAANNQGVYKEVCKHMPSEYNSLKTTEEYKKDVYSAVANEYLVLSEYLGRSKKILMQHTFCSNSYEVTPKDFLSGRRCPYCTHYGFNFNKPAILYYLTLLVGDVEYFKIGITNNSISSRCSITEQKLITSSLSFNFKNGNEAYEAEQQLLKIFKKYRYTGDKILCSGNTEILTKDIKERNEFTKIIQKNKKQ
jgi:hypothetical protein